MHYWCACVGLYNTMVRCFLEITFNCPWISNYSYYHLKSTSKSFYGRDSLLCNWIFESWSISEMKYYFPRCLYVPRYFFGSMIFFFRCSLLRPTLCNCCICSPRFYITVDVNTDIDFVLFVMILRSFHFLYKWQTD